MMKRVNEILFRAVVLGFSALLLVLTLLCSIRLTAAQDELRRLDLQISEAEEANGALRVRLENAMSLEEIERYAAEVLGMQHCEAGQVVYIREGEDRSA